MRTIDLKLIKGLIEKAKKSPRKRAHFLLHQHQDPVQRMINALVPGSYIPPHKHQNPDKIELFTILIGRIACLKFTSRGKIDKIHVLDEKGPIKIVDIRPKIYHSFVALKPSALLEIIQGPYEQSTHKNFPSWVPKEDSPKASPYLKSLTQKINQHLIRKTNHGRN